LDIILIYKLQVIDLNKIHCQNTFYFFILEPNFESFKMSLRHHFIIIIIWHIRTHEWKI